MAFEDLYASPYTQHVNADDDMLMAIARASLTPLAWVGETLDKPGRALRGLLSGRPEELLNLIPFSDSLDITDPSKQVTGRDLLRQYGAIGEEDTWGNFLGGLAAEIVLDPVNLIGSPLTAAGKIAKMENRLAPTLAKRIAEGQSGLVGARTPWFTDVLGITKPSNMPLLTRNAPTQVPFGPLDSPAVQKAAQLRQADPLLSMEQAMIMARNNPSVQTAESLLTEFAPGPRSWGEYLAGQAFTDTRNLIDKVPGMPAVTGLADAAYGKGLSLFAPGSGITGDKRIAHTMRATNIPTQEAVMDSLLQPRLEIAEQLHNASKVLKERGIVGPAAEDALNEMAVYAMEGVPIPGKSGASPFVQQAADLRAKDPSLSLQEALGIARKDPSAQAASQLFASVGTKVEQLGGQDLVEQLRPYMEKIAGNRVVQDLARAKAIEAGFDIGDDPNIWGLDFLERQAQFTEGGAKGAAKKGRSIPDSIFPKGTNQVNDAFNKSGLAGLLTQPTPAGYTRAQWEKHVDGLIDDWARTHVATEVAPTRDTKFPALEQPAVTPAPSPQPVAPTLSPVEEIAAEQLKQTKKQALIDQAKSLGITNIRKNDTVSQIRDAIRAKGAEPVEAASGSNVRQVINTEVASSAPAKSSLSIEDLKDALDTQGLARGDFAQFLLKEGRTLDDEVYKYAKDNFLTELMGLPEKSQARVVQEAGAKNLDDFLDQLLAAEKKAPPAQAAPTPAAPKPTSPVVQPLSKQIDDAIAEGEAKMAAEAANPALQRPPELPYPASLADDALISDAKKFGKYIANLPQDMAKEGRGFFRNDIIGGIDQYVAGRAEDAGKGMSMLQVFANEAKTAAEIADDPGKYVKLNIAMKKAGLTGNDIVSEGKTRVIERGGKLTLARKLEEVGKASPMGEGPAKLSVVNKRLKEYYVPRDLVDQIANEMRPPIVSKVGAFTSMIEPATAGLRAWFTLPWLPFHARNAWEGMVQQALSSGSDPTMVREAAEYMAGAMKDPAKVAEWDNIFNLAYNTKAAGRHQMAELLGKTVVGKESKTVRPWVEQGRDSITDATKDFLEGFKPSKAAERGETYKTLDPQRNTLIQQMARLSSASDDLQRVSTFASYLKQGYSPQAASKLVTDAFLDYSRLTPFERNLRQVIPFYSFSRRNLSRIAGQLEDPGPIASLLRAGTQGGEQSPVPDYMGTGAAIPIPGGEDGKQRYLAGLGMPYEDEMLGSIMAMMAGRPVESFRRGLQTLNPLVKLPITLGTGRDIYSGRSLDDMSPTGFSSLFPGTSGNYAAQVVSATPLGRVMSTVNSAVAGRDQHPLLKALTGIRTTDVNPLMAAQQTTRKNLTEYLKSTGQVRATEQLYPRDPNVNNEEIDKLLELLNAVKSRGAEIYRAGQPQP